MERSLRQTVLKISKEAAFIIAAIIGAVVLPQIFHVAGIMLGVGGKLGQIFLPMYLPVLIIAFYRGPISGAVAGLVSPLISFVLTAMPHQSLLPYITVELIAIGLLAGELCNSAKIPAVLRVLAVQVAAKAVRLAVLAVSLYGATGVVSLDAAFADILISVPGAILQLVLVTGLIVIKENKNA